MARLQPGGQPRPRPCRRRGLAPLHPLPGPRLRQPPAHGQHYDIAELAVDSHDWLANKPLVDLHLRDEGVLVLGITRKDGTYLGTPHGDTLIEPGDVLIIYGCTDNLEELDSRRSGAFGQARHRRAVRAARRRLAEERAHDPARHHDGAPPDDGHDDAGDSGRAGRSMEHGSASRAPGDPDSAPPPPH